MRVITRVDPFTYAVHGFKSVILKGTTIGAVAPDMLFLLGFTCAAMGLATLLFRRTL
jgi:ABC-2 type transport system permease protein